MPPERSDSVGSAKPVAPESVPRPDPELLPDSPRLRELELPPPLGWHLRATLMLTSVLSLQTPHRSAPPWCPGGAKPARTRRHTSQTRCVTSTSPSMRHCLHRLARSPSFAYAGRRSRHDSQSISPTGASPGWRHCLHLTGAARIPCGALRPPPGSTTARRCPHVSHILCVTLTSPGRRQTAHRAAVRTFAGANRARRSLHASHSLCFMETSVVKRQSPQRCGSAPPLGPNDAFRFPHTLHRVVGDCGAGLPPNPAAEPMAAWRTEAAIAAAAAATAAAPCTDSLSTRCAGIFSAGGGGGGAWPTRLAAMLYGMPPTADAGGGGTGTAWLLSSLASLSAACSLYTAASGVIINEDKMGRPVLEKDLMFKDQRA